MVSRIGHGGRRPPGPWDGRAGAVQIQRPVVSIIAVPVAGVTGNATEIVEDLAQADQRSAPRAMGSGGSALQVSPATSYRHT